MIFNDAAVSMNHYVRPNVYLFVLERLAIGTTAWNMYKKFVLVTSHYFQFIVFTSKVVFHLI